MSLTVDKALPVLVLRPEPGATATVDAACAMGLAARAFPLFEVRSLPWKPVDRHDIDAVLLGSANALRHGGEALALYRGLPAYTVGIKTADAARVAGLDVIATGSGGLQQLLSTVSPGHRRLLRLCGRERVRLDLPDDIVLTTREVYASEPQPLSPDLASCLMRPAVVLLHSGEAAAHFAGLCERAGIDRRALSLAAIGPRVAARAGSGWAMVRSAGRPCDAALLAMAAQMCKEASSGSQLPEQG